MEKQELKAYGYFLAEIKAALDGKLGKNEGVTLNEVDAYYRTPRLGMPSLYKKAMSNDIIKGDTEVIITCILDGIKGEDDEGTSEKPIGVEKQGTMLLAYHHWMANIQDGGNMVDAADAAEELGVSLQRIYKMIDEGKLDGVKVGKKWRVCRSSLDVRKQIMNSSK